MSTSVVTSSWMRVGHVAPGALADARLQLHHAAQIAVSAAISYIAARPDDSHTALTWVAPLGALATEPITAARQFRIALRLEDLTLHVLGENEVPTRSFALPGHTVAEGQGWLGEVLAQAALDPARLTARKHYTIPPHPVASGATFSLGTSGELQELARYWSNAAGALAGLARAAAGAGPVRTWPHHFDIATLIGLPGAGGRTIGVLGSGVDRIYPPEHRGLAEKMVESGAIVSDYAPGTPPDASNFPPRNRIISGLSLAVVVIEAGETSGALITAEFAAEQGREVFAVPGSILAPQSKGTNKLIQNGALPLLSVNDLMQPLNLTHMGEHKAARKTIPSDETEARLMNVLGAEPLHVDEIRNQTDLPIEKVSATLALMELKGMVRQVGGMNYVAVREVQSDYSTSGG